MTDKIKNLNVHLKIVDCQCACGHCLLHGGKGDFVLPIEKIEQVILEMENCKAEEKYLFPLDDISNYPNFYRILDLDKKYGMKRTTFSTNGTKGFDEEELKKLKSHGIESLQLAFHGVAKNHDRFVCYERAFESLIATIKAALKVDMKLWIVYFIRQDNVAESKQLYDMLVALGVNKEDIGIFQSQYIGRAARSDAFRFRDREELYDCIDHYGFGFKKYFTEGECLERVKSEDEWSRQVFRPDFENIELLIDKDLEVYHLKYNHHYYKDLTDYKDKLSLGNLESTSLKEIVEKYKIKRPPMLEILEKIDYRELAETIGDKNDILYTHNDPMEYKWQYLYLMKRSKDLV